MAKAIWGDEATQYFYQLTPEKILNYLDTLGLETTGRCLVMNSMENRVYEIEITNPQRFGLESYPSVIAKFYRPGRWSKKQIEDEHLFLWQLKDLEIPVIAPLKIDGQTLFTLPDPQVYFTLFPRKGGRSPSELSEDRWLQLGRLIGRIHNIGSSHPFSSRLTLNPYTLGQANFHLLEKSDLIPMGQKSTYLRAVEDTLPLIKKLFDTINPTMIRVHGDCHLGNILFREDSGFMLIDFDDCLQGPAVQDIWLCLPGRGPEDIAKRNALIEGYEMMFPFAMGQIKLIEALRTLRLIHYSAWVNKRFDDPYFNQVFQYFKEDSYWMEQTYILIEQKRLMEQALGESPWDSDPYGAY